MSRNVHEAHVAAIEPRARGIVEWRLRVTPSPEGAGAPLTFRPGQFISVSCGDDADGNPILRSYSIASSPADAARGELSLILKLVEGGAGSAWFRRLHVGDRVRFTGPMGFFCLELAHAGDVAIGATGVGITPVLAMVEELLARPAETGQVHLLWGNRDADDLFWLQPLEALARAHPRFHLRLFLSQSAPPDWQGERGRIAAPLLALAPTLTRPTFYLVGNGAMIREIKAGLQAQGVDRKRQIRTEAFFD